MLKGAYYIEAVFMGQANINRDNVLLIKNEGFILAESQLLILMDIPWKRGAQHVDGDS